MSYRSLLFVLGVAWALVSFQILVHQVSASPVTKMYVDPPSQSVSASFTVDVNVTDVVDLYGWEFRLNYSTSILTATSVTEGPFLQYGADRFLYLSDNDDFIYKMFVGDPSTSQGSWDCGTSRPYGVEYINGYIYYVDYSADMLYQKTLAGGAVASWDISGYSGDAYGLGWDGTYFLIADKGDDRIYFVNPSTPTSYVRYITYSAVTAVEGVTFDGTYIWVSDTGTDRVYKLNPTTGATLAYWPGGTSDLGFDPNGITWDGMSLWICTSGNIYQYSTTGTQLASFTDLSGESEGLGYAAIAPTSPRTTFYSVTELNDTIGRVWVTGSLTGHTAGVAGGGVIATINFDIDASGNTALDLHSTRLVGYDYANQVTTRITHVSYDGTVNATGVPEFPFGAAAEIGIAAAVIYLWWRRRRIKLRTSPLSPAS